MEVTSATEFQGTTKAPLGSTEIRHQQDHALPLIASHAGQRERRRSKGYDRPSFLEGRRKHGAAGSAGHLSIVLRKYCLRIKYPNKSRIRIGLAPRYIEPPCPVSPQA